MDHETTDGHSPCRTGETMATEARYGTGTLRECSQDRPADTRGSCRRPTGHQGRVLLSGAAGGHGYAAVNDRPRLGKQIGAHTRSPGVRVIPVEQRLPGASV